MRETLTPSPWTGWNPALAVEVEQVPAPAFYATAYAVFVDGAHAGYVLSQRAARRQTLWASTTGPLDGRHVAGVPSRRAAVEAVVFEAARPTPGLTPG